MTVHSFHIFDRHGKRLFYKRYYVKTLGEPEETPKQQDDQLKLMFGMLLSLRELCGKLSPNDDDMGDVHLVKTGAACLYNFETVSGLRFVLYTTAETAVGRTITSVSGSASSTTTTPTSSGTASNTNSNNIVTTAASSITSATPIFTSATSTLGVGTTTTTTTTTPLASPPSSNPNSSGGSFHGGNVITIPNTTATMTNPAITAQIRHALRYIYEHLWVTYVVRSPLYRPPHHPNLKSTNFEVLLDQYLMGMPWFR
jgi:hypothetical protein